VRDYPILRKKNMVKIKLYRWTIILFVRGSFVTQISMRVGQCLFLAFYRRKRDIALSSTIKRWLNRALGRHNQTAANWGHVSLRRLSHPKKLLAAFMHAWVYCASNAY
jgi:hypothetical protein